MDNRPRLESPDRSEMLHGHTRERRRWLAAAAACALGGVAAGLPLARAATPARVLLIRHAQTVSGIGDPPGFRLDDCGTQRNLDQRGREQARQIGQLLREQGLVPDRVRSSRWCRCLETARLAFGEVEPWNALDSFFADRERQAAQVAEMRRALAALPASRLEAWVTHQVNISALAGEFTSMGEVLLVEAQPALRLLRRIAP